MVMTSVYCQACNWWREVDGDDIWLFPGPVLLANAFESPFFVILPLLVPNRRNLTKCFPPGIKEALLEVNGLKKDRMCSLHQ